MLLVRLTFEFVVLFACAFGSVIAIAVILRWFLRLMGTHDAIGGDTTDLYLVRTLVSLELLGLACAAVILSRTYCISAIGHPIFMGDGLAFTTVEYPQSVVSVLLGIVAGIWSTRPAKGCYRDDRVFIATIGLILALVGIYVFVETVRNSRSGTFRLTQAVRFGPPDTARQEFR